MSYDDEILRHGAAAPGVAHELNTTAGALLRDARVTAGLSLRMAAASAGLTPVQLGELERGQRGPSIETFERFGRALWAIAALVPRRADADQRERDARCWRAMRQFAEGEPSEGTLRHLVQALDRAAARCEPGDDET